MTRAWPTLVATGVAAALLWALTATQGANPQLEGAHIGGVHDFLGYYRPNADYLGLRLAAGEIPLWNPHQALGAPFLASLQPGALYPPNLLHALLPSQTAFVLLAALHLALAAGFAGALARSLGASLPGAALAGLLYGASARLFAEVWIPPELYTTAWMPALLLLTERTVARPSAGCAGGLAVALALQILAGWPYGVAITGLSCAMYGGAALLARMLRERRVPFGAIGALAGAALAGVALAAPQLLPTLELIERSCRAFGSVSAPQAIAGLPGHDPWLFFETLLRYGSNSAVPSLGALALAALALARPAEDRLRPWTLFALGLLGLAASFPEHLPVYEGLRALPVLGDFRFPFRYRGITLLVIAALAGLGVTWIGHATRSRPWLRSGLLVAIVALALVPSLRAVPRTAPAFPRQVALPPSEAERLRALGAPPADGFRRVFWAGRTEKVRTESDLQVLFDLEPFSLARKAQLLTFLEVGEARTVYGPPPGVPGPTQPFAGRLDLPETPERARIVDLLSADLVAPRRPQPWLAERYRRLGPPTAKEQVYANPHGLPHAYWVGSAEAEPGDPQQALARLVAPDFDPHRRVLLDLLPEPARGSDPMAVGDAQIEQYAAERVVLRTRATAPGFAVLTDAWFPGWEARIDGARSPVLRANTLFRAVAVPAGEHVIELRYRPQSFRIGLATAIAAAVALAAMSPLSPRSAPTGTAVPAPDEAGREAPSTRGARPGA